MKVTLKFLKKHDACEHGIIWFKNQKETDPIKLIHKLIEEKKFNWANWGITRLLGKLDCVRYAVFAAELALPIFENNRPDDKNPRDAIEAAKNYIANPTKENAAKAADAADAADAAAAYAAYAAAYAAYYAAADAAYYAAANAAFADDVYKKIMEYGFSLLGVNNDVYM